MRTSTVRAAAMAIGALGAAAFAAPNRRTEPRPEAPEPKLQIDAKRIGWGPYSRKLTKAEKKARKRKRTKERVSP